MVDDRKGRQRQVTVSEELVVTELQLALEQEFGEAVGSAGILDLMNDKHDPDFVKRVAWEMTDPEDRKKLFAAASVLGVDAVIKKIIERTGAVFEDRTVNSRINTEEAVLEVGEGDGRRVVIRHDVHWPDKTDLYFMERR